MAATHGAPADLGSVGVLILLAACLCVVYWRTALRIAAIVIIALAAYGAVLLIEGLHHMAG